MMGFVAKSCVIIHYKSSNVQKQSGHSGETEHPSSVVLPSRSDTGQIPPESFGLDLFLYSHKCTKVGDKLFVSVDNLYTTHQLLWCIACLAK